jgi:hypothetical protein
MHLVTTELYTQTKSRGFVSKLVCKLRLPLVLALSFILAQSLVLSGCVRRPSPPPSSANAPIPYLYHTISFPGETLALIALWYTGQASNWQLVLQHNPGLDVLKMQRGDTIRIPKSLVIKETPLPASAVKSPRTLSTGQAASVPPAEPTDQGVSQNTPQAATTPVADQKKIEPLEEKPLAARESRASPLSEFSAATPIQTSTPAASEKPTQGQAVDSTKVIKAAPVASATSSSPTPVKEKSREELLRELTEEY